MSLPIYQTQSKDLGLMQTQWSSQLNPVIACPLVNGLQLKNVALAIGSNTINHTLSRVYQGYIITGMHKTYAQIYDTPSTMPAVNLVLNASAATSVDIWVY